MNPFALFLLAAAVGNRTPAKVSALNIPDRMPGASDPVRLFPPPDLNTLLDQLHRAVNALEKVSEIQRLGSSLMNDPRPPLPSSARVPAPPAESVQADAVPASEQTPAAPLPDLSAIDLQNAMQSLAPVLSLLSKDQPAR